MLSNSVPNFPEKSTSSTPFSRILSIPPSTDKKNQTPLPKDFSSIVSNKNAYSRSKSDLSVGKFSTEPPSTNASKTSLKSQGRDFSTPLSGSKLRLPEIDEEKTISQPKVKKTLSVSFSKQPGEIDPDVYETKVGPNCGLDPKVQIDKIASQYWVNISTCQLHWLKTKSLSTISKANLFESISSMPSRPVCSIIHL